MKNNRIEEYCDELQMVLWAMLRNVRKEIMRKNAPLMEGSQ